MTIMENYRDPDLSPDEAITEVVGEPRFSWSRTLYCLDDDPMWRPQGETEMRYIGEFKPAHRMRLLNYILTRADKIGDSMALAVMTGPQPDGDMACEAVERIIDDLFDRSLETLWNTQFIRALCALLIGDGYRVVVERWEREISGAPLPMQHVLTEF